MELSDIDSIGKLASYLALQEGKKVQVKIGDIREVLRLLSIAGFQDNNVLDLVWVNGKKIAHKGKWKK